MFIGLRTSTAAAGRTRRGRAAPGTCPEAPDSTAPPALPDTGTIGGFIPAVPAAEPETEGENVIRFDTDAQRFDSTAARFDGAAAMAAASFDSSMLRFDTTAVRFDGAQFAPAPVVVVRFDADDVRFDMVTLRFDAAAIAPGDGAPVELSHPSTYDEAA